jgi:hypothetical protein
LWVLFGDAMLGGWAGLCREDDAPAPVRAYRGTTSLAARPVFGAIFRRPLVTRL